VGLFAGAGVLMLLVSSWLTASLCGAETRTPPRAAGQALLSQPPA